MYRQPDTTPRCTACGAVEVTPATFFDNTEGYPRIHFHILGAQPNFLGSKPTETVDVNRARVCLACGHVMLGVSPDQLTALRQKAHALEPFQ
jgi:hypothetical protein